MMNDGSLGTSAPTLPDADATDIAASRNLESLAGGRYRITELLGEGGMSTVYGATDTLLDRVVAIKILRVGRDIPALEREARILAAVHHTNVVVVYALHSAEDPPSLVMERIDGRPLNEVRRSQGSSVRGALGLLRQIAAGLDAIHAAGLVHGDIKPSNVLVDREGRVKILDMGLAHALERMQPGQIVGTPAYMPPERAQGVVLPPHLVARSDIYSFAVLAFEMLTGVRPFTDPLQEAVLDAHASRPAPRPSRVSSLARVFDEPFARALSKNAADRPGSAGLVVDALDCAALGAEPGGATLRMLLVDDDPHVRAIESTILASRLRGAEIETASEGAAALESIARRVPSVAIFDLQMPGLSGIDLIRAARELAPELPIIVCTGHGSGAEWTEARKLGVRHFLIKPVDTVALIHAIRDSVDPPPLQRGAREA